MTTRRGKHLQKLLIHRFYARMQRKRRVYLRGVPPAELHHPRVVDGERVIQEDDVPETVLLAQLAKLREDVDVRSAATVLLASGRVQLVVHASRAVRTWERTAPLCRHVYRARRLIQKISGQKRQAIQGRNGRTQRRSMRLTALPDVVDGVRRSTGFQRLDQLEHRLLSLAEADVI